MTPCPHPAKARKLITEESYALPFVDDAYERATFGHCTACGQDVGRVPGGRDAQPCRCGGTEET